METTHARNGVKNEMPASTETIGGSKNKYRGREQRKNFTQESKQQHQGRTQQNPRGATENIDPRKNTNRRQPHHEDEVLPNNEEPTPTQPAIKIISTPPAEQGKANSNGKTGQRKQHPANRGNAQNKGTARTHEEGENMGLEQAHEERRKKSTGADNTKDPRNKEAQY